MTSLKIKEIIDVKKENQYVKTIFFNNDINIIPGQFFMIWIPDVDEIPMSVSYINNDFYAITFRKVGDATNKLFNYEIGDKVGVRGPHGNGFKFNSKNIVFVGGGTGIATLAPAIEKAIYDNIKIKILKGFRNKNEVFFKERFEKLTDDLFISTDDGSIGYNGDVINMAKKIIIDTDFSLLTCGPEVMMKKLFDIYKSHLFQASIERYMKCGVGVCGQCCIGDGLRVCLEGPVLDKDSLKKIDDFGKYKRNECGNIEYL